MSKVDFGGGTTVEVMADNSIIIEHKKTDIEELLNALEFYCKGAWEETGIGIHYDTGILAKAYRRAQALLSKHGR